MHHFKRSTLYFSSPLCTCIQGTIGVCGDKLFRVHTDNSPAVESFLSWTLVGACEVIPASEREKKC